MVYKKHPLTVQNYSQVRSLTSVTDYNALASRSIGLQVPIVARSDDVCDIQRRCVRDGELEAPPTEVQKTASPITKHSLEKRSKIGDFFKKIGHGIKTGFQKVGHWLKDNWQTVLQVGETVVKDVKIPA
jgi:hypothetical protein